MLTIHKVKKNNWQIKRRKLPETTTRSPTSKSHSPSSVGAVEGAEGAAAVVVGVLETSDEEDVVRDIAVGAFKPEEGKGCKSYIANANGILSATNTRTPTCQVPHYYQ